MRMTGSGAYSRRAPVPKMPPGLVQLMEGLARDVLKNNPQDVEEFCARHMEQLLAIRDGEAKRKRQLTLEEKIKRAQEKIRQKAEQRRHKYDQDMKKLNDGKKLGISDEEVNEEITNTNQKDKGVSEEVKSTEEPLIETNLKVPVTATVTEEIPSTSQNEENVPKEVKPPTESKLETKLKVSVTATEDISSTSLDEIIPEGVKPAKGSKTETKLKAPVHHEKDLAEALEVEIFHKPVEEVRPFMTSEAIDVVTQSEEDPKDTVGNQEELPHTRLNETLDDQDATGLLVKAIDNENVADGAHMRSRRSVNLEDNEKNQEEYLEDENIVVESQLSDTPKEKTDEHALKETIVSLMNENAVNADDANNAEKITNFVETQNIRSNELNNAHTSNDTITNPAPEPPTVILLDDNDEDNIAANENTSVTNQSAKVSKTASEKAEELKDERGVNESLTVSSLPLNENPSEIDQKSKNITEAEEKHNTLINAAQNIYNATVFANKVSSSPASSEVKTTINLSMNNSNTATQDVEASVLTSSTVEIVPNVDNVSNADEVGTISEKAGNKDAEENNENIENISNTEETIKLNDTENIENKESSTENAVKLNVAGDNSLHKDENDVLKKGEKLDEINTSIISDDNNTLDETETNPGNNKEVALNDTNVIAGAMEVKLVGKENIDLNENGSHTTGTDAKRILNDDKKIIEAVEKLEVFSGPVQEVQFEKESSYTCNELLNEPAKDVEAVNKKVSVCDENGDGAITTVDKVLVEEPEAINDDNDSAPELQIVDNDNSSTVHVNGTLGLVKNETPLEYGSESLKQEIIPTTHDATPKQDIQIKDIITTEAHDDATSASEPIKTDLETSSAGKSSSMDNSYIDDGDSITEAEELKTGAEAQQKKETSGMDLETAAITIQKVFRTFMFKSRESTFDETGMGGSDSIDGDDGDSEKTEVEFAVTSSPLNKERRTLGISRMDTVLQTVNEEKSLSLSTDDSSLSSAATIIQAHVRGFLTRSRLNSNKTNSSSLVNSDGGPSSTSLENEPEQKVNKTVLNIHIVPEGEHFLSRDESILTSMELSLDGSPPSSTNLHPLGYDKSEPRKQLKREDAIQSISPPSNNSGKLSEDVDSVKDMPITDLEQQKITDSKEEPRKDIDIDRDDTPTKSTTIETVIEAQKISKDISSSPEPEKDDVDTAVRRKRSINLSSDEGDVVTPFEGRMSTDSDATSRLLHSGEFHDVVLPTKVLRGDTAAVRGE
ncbi:hypothetical protein O0L34_g915 [Tuta absoluta]|nr:hypothetical protein O0L34_g915 [Tuta absoluta]